MAKERIWSEKQKRIFEWGRAPELVATTLLASLMKAGCWYTGLDGKAITLANVSGGVVTVRDTRGQETKLEATSLVRRRNLVVRARAGTGKTTTVEELCKHYAPERRQYVGAFNNRIYKELAERFEGIDYVETMTLHTLGHQFIKRQWNTARLDKVGARMERLARTAAGHDAPDQMISHIIDLAGHGKNMAPFGDAESLVPIAYRFQCAPDDEWRQYGWTVQRVAQLARQVMSRALQQDGQYDFDDMLFAPVANRWVNGRYDLVVIDEAQDMNYTQLLLALKVCLPGGRIVVVGDDRQAIYGFRGADSGSIDRLKEELDADELPLDTTYRCPKLVVKCAQRCVPSFFAADSSPEGVEETIGYGKIVESAQLGDVVLSRKNAPLMGVCLSLLRAGKRAKIEGRSIGKSLLSVVRKLKAKNITDLLTRLTKWSEREISKARALPKAQQADRIDEVEDTAETIAALCDNLATLKEFENRVQDLFSDDEYDKDPRPKIVCSSVHKAKGLEWNRVFVLEWTFKATSGEGEEANLYYVAVTRSQGELYHVTEKDAVAPLLTQKCGSCGEELSKHASGCINAWSESEAGQKQLDSGEAALDELLKLAARADAREAARQRHLKR